MGLTESTSSIKGEQVEREDEDTQKRTAVSPAQINNYQKQVPSSQQNINPPGEQSEKQALMIQEEAPDQHVEQEGSSQETPSTAIASSPGEPEALSVEKPLELSENRPETPSRLPAFPRKNVIPSRRTSFESGARSQQVVKKSAFSLENRQQNLSRSAERDEEKLDLSERATSILPIPPHAAQDRQITAQPMQAKNESRQGEEKTFEIAGSNEHTSTHIDEYKPAIEQAPEQAEESPPSDDIATQILPVPKTPPSRGEMPTTPLPVVQPASLEKRRNTQLSRGRAFFLALLLIIVVINATLAGFGQFFGPQGWGSVFNDPNNTNGKNLLDQISKQLQHTPTPGATAQATPAPLTPDQIVDALISHMTLEQKLGQMMIVQFNAQSYIPQLDAMIRQYHVGGVIFFQYNIGSKNQLKTLNAQMQRNADLPLIISVDQEGGTVDRFVNLDGAQPSAESIGQTGDPNNAYNQGVQDAKNLASYGFNLNLAPVVDVHSVYNQQLYLRTYGDTPEVVTRMAGAYLEGLQKSGKVLGTLKHFPGLGDVGDDPHVRPPDLTRSLQDLNSIDWAPYRDLISKGNVYSIMVTHEYVQALDTNEPSSLSPRVIGILRNQLNFKGVIITDGLTMASITNFYTPGQAAAKAVEAGDDILMGAASPNDVAAMINGIKQAMNSGAITEQRINESVRRILLFKYQMGLLHINP